MVNSKRSKILSGISKIADKQRKKEMKLNKYNSMDTISVLNSLKLKVKPKKKTAGSKGIENALELVSKEIDNYKLKMI